MKNDNPALIPFLCDLSLVFIRLLVAYLVAHPVLYAECLWSIYAWADHFDEGVKKNTPVHLWFFWSVCAAASAYLLLSTGQYILLELNSLHEIRISVMYILVSIFSVFLRELLFIMWTHIIPDLSLSVIRRKTVLSLAVIAAVVVARIPVGPLAYIAFPVPVILLALVLGCSVKRLYHLLEMRYFYDIDR